MGRAKSDMNRGTPRVTTNGGHGSPQCTGNGSRLEDQVAIDWRSPSVGESGVSLKNKTGEFGGRLYDKDTGRNCQYGLNQQVNWPTPRQSDPEGGRANAEFTGSTFETTRKSGLKIRAKLRDASEMNESASSKLNPSWVEQLMGLPVGHTQLRGHTNPEDNRIDRLRLLGNGVVPQTAAKAFSTLLARVESE